MQKTTKLTEEQRDNLHMYFLLKYGATAADYTHQIANVIEVGVDNLCKNCHGTGNQLLSMYQTCEICKGTGVKP